MKKYYLFCCSLLIISCTKKTQVNGRVLSKYKYALQNEIIHLYEYKDKDYPRPYSIKEIAKTDVEGYFSFVYKTKSRSNFFYKIQIRSDSGYSQSYDLKKGTRNDIEIILHQ